MDQEAWRLDSDRYTERVHFEEPEGEAAGVGRPPTSYLTAGRYNGAFRPHIRDARDQMAAEIVKFDALRRLTVSGSVNRRAGTLWSGVPRPVLTTIPVLEVRGSMTKNHESGATA